MNEQYDIGRDYYQLKGCEHNTCSPFLYFMARPPKRSIIRCPSLYFANFKPEPDSFLVNTEELIDYSNQDIIGVILNGGKLQKGKNILPATEIQATESGEIEILIQGLVSEQQIVELFDHNVNT